MMICVTGGRKRIFIDTKFTNLEIKFCNSKYFPLTHPQNILPVQSRVYTYKLFKENDKYLWCLGKLTPFLFYGTGFPV